MYVVGLYLRFLVSVKTLLAALSHVDPGETSVID